MGKYDGLLDQLIARREAENAAKVFHYSSYWGSWSRILARENGWTTEVNLTVIPCCYSSTWDKDVFPNQGY